MHRIAPNENMAAPSLRELIRPESHASDIQILNAGRHRGNFRRDLRSWHVHGQIHGTRLSRCMICLLTQIASQNHWNGVAVLYSLPDNNPLRRTPYGLEMEVWYGNLLPHPEKLYFEQGS